MKGCIVYANGAMVVAPFDPKEGDILEVSLDGVPKVGIIYEGGRLRVGSFGGDGQWRDLGEL